VLEGRTGRLRYVNAGHNTQVLFTDGLGEAEDEAGEPFGMERLEALLKVHRAGDLPGLFARVDEAVRGHRGRLEPADDATILGLRVAGPGIGGQTA